MEDTKVLSSSLGEKFRGVVSAYDCNRGFGFLVQPGKFKSKTFFHVSNWDSDVPPAVGLIVDYVLGVGKSVHQVQATQIVVVASLRHTSPAVESTPLNAALSVLAVKSDTQEAK
jgi:hypothetical protein